MYKVVPFGNVSGIYKRIPPSRTRFYGLENTEIGQIIVTTSNSTHCVHVCHLLDLLFSEVDLDVEYCEQLHSMLSRCDFVVITCSLTEQTRNLVGKEEFDAMKTTATLINVGRGSIISLTVVTIHFLNHHHLKDHFGEVFF